MTKTAEDRGAAIRGALHALIARHLPLYCNADGLSLNVKDLHSAIGMSHEGVYKWLRSNQITTRAAKKVVALSERADNRTRLVALGREPAKFEDFTDFLA